MPIETANVGVRPVGPAQQSNTDNTVRRTPASSGSGFAPETKVALRSAIQDMAGVLTQVNEAQAESVEKMPKAMQDVIDNIMRQAFSLEETLSQGLGSTLESQRFSTEQLKTFSRMLAQLGNILSKGGEAGTSDTLTALLKNFKVLLSEEGNGTEPVLLTKAAFALIDEVPMEQLPVRMQQLFAALQQPYDGTVTGNRAALQVLRQLVQDFMPQTGSTGTQSGQSAAQAGQGTGQPGSAAAGQQSGNVVFTGQNGTGNAAAGQTAAGNAAAGNNGLGSAAGTASGTVANAATAGQGAAAGTANAPGTAAANATGQPVNAGTAGLAEGTVAHGPAGQTTAGGAQAGAAGNAQTAGQAAGNGQPQANTGASALAENGQAGAGTATGGQQTAGTAQGSQQAAGMPQAGTGTGNAGSAPAGTGMPSGARQGATGQGSPLTPEQQAARPQVTAQENRQTILQGQQTVVQGQQMAQQGQKVMQQGAQMMQQGQQLLQQGQSMAQQGEHLVAQGQLMVEQGQQLLAQDGPTSRQGQQLVKQGQQTLQQGQEMQTQGERLTQQGQQLGTQGQQNLQQGLQLQDRGQQTIQQGQALLQQAREALPGQEALRTAMQQAREQLLSQPMQNTAQTMDTLRSMARLLLRDAVLAPQDAQLLQSFAESGTQKLDASEARQLQQLLRVCQQNVPAAVQQAAVQRQMPELPRVWSLMQLADMTAARDMTPQQLQRTSHDLAVLANAMNQSMTGDNTTALPGQRSLDFMMPLYMGQPQQSYPTYIHVYDENQPDKRTGVLKKETWFRVCVLTQNIGAVDATFRVYEGSRLDMRVFFSRPEQAEEFTQYMPALRKSLRETRLLLQDVKIGAV